MHSFPPLPSLLGRLLLSAQVSKPRSFTMLTLLRIALLMLLGPASCDDTVADDIGSHMMDRLSELLSPEECQSFYTKITGPEEDVVLKLEQLSESKNPIQIRRRRDITSTEQCKKTLSHWLDTEGDTMYWDRLSQALQAIGRSDVSMELGKNLNQDKNLEIKKNVEDYHKTVQHLTSSLLLEENEMHGQERLRRDRETTVPEPEEWELIVERELLAPYNRSLFGWVNPIAVGVVGGFLSSFVIGALALYSFLWILKERRPESLFETILPPHFPPLTNLPEGGAVYYMYQQFGETWQDEPAANEDDDDNSS
ncbi:transmembrane and death domain protein 1 [Tiliqua scincoides]|uniref:transmembrane and death domain protein 1 n=1 Tax=Tiliqua scincoides TaxID=71010 RepID=UPI003462D6E0